MGSVSTRLEQEIEQAGTFLTHTHDLRLVMLSIAIALVGSFAALDMADQAMLARG